MSLHSPVAVSSPSRHEIFLVSSSPTLPSLDTLLKKKRSPPVPKPGSRAAPIPAGAASGFQSARLLAREAVHDDVVDEAAQKLDKPRKRRKKSEETENVATQREKDPGVKENGKEERPSPKLGRYILNAAESIEDLAETKVQPKSKARKSKQRDEASKASPLAGAAQSPGLSERLPKDKPKARPLGQAVQARDTSTKSVISTDAPSASVPEPPPPPQQERAMTTVIESETRTTSNEQSYSKEVYNGGDKAIEEVTTTAPPVLDFQAAWSYTGADAPAKEITSTASDEAESKIEKPKAAAKNPRASPVKKSKQPTKSSRTVTNIAIARYQADEEQPKESISDWYNSASQRAKKLLEPDLGAKAKGKAKGKPQPKKLPDPEAAMARVEKQEFFFGTSSQLTRDEPAEHLRDLQKALQASETGVAPDEDNNATPAGLWATASRNSDHGLLEAEETARHVKLYSPKRVAFRDREDADVEVREHRLTTVSNGTTKGVLHSISLNILPSACSTPRDLSPVKSTGRAYNTSAAQEDKESAKPKKPRGRPRKDGSAPSFSPKARTKKSKNTADEDGLTKPPNKSKAKKAKSAAEAAETTDEPPLEQEAVYQDIDDIPEDLGEAEAEASTKTSRKPKATLKRQREEFMASKAAILFPAMTQIVKDQKKDTNDPKALTWYEKMLLYDPIVLEDLTAWLKASPLSDQHEELCAELKPWQVQLWCEDQSICCLWREGLRGGVKLKY